jgi:hypothetical protein
MPRIFVGALCTLLVMCLSASALASEPAKGLRGVYFNPPVSADPGYPWLIFYDAHRAKVKTALSELHAEAGINFVDLQILIANTLRVAGQGNRVGQRVEEWANLSMLDNLARFVDDCHEAGVVAELDLVDNRWIPHTIDPTRHIGRPGNPWWPVPDETPWDEAAQWYAQMIEYVESHAAHPEAIAMWCMLGNYQLGGAEPMLWGNTQLPEIGKFTERFVKSAWPVMRTAGRRPKAAPILLPIFAAGGYWERKSPADRLEGFTNLKRWLVDDLKQPPDYWVMTTYPYCDPAPDGFWYLREIVKILGVENAGRIISTDFKGEGHDDETRGTILLREGRTGSEMLRWHVDKCREYGFAGWWMWNYQDSAASKMGLRRIDGSWKNDLLRETVRRDGR